MTIEDEICKILQRQFGCKPTPKECKTGNFIKKTDGTPYQVDVCCAIKHISRITWEDEKRRRGI